MYKPDETHAKLMAAIDGLGDARKTITKAMWAAVTFYQVRDLIEYGEVEVVKRFLATAADDISKLPKRLIAAESAIDTAVAALSLAREKLPDTTPPDPRGFESMSALEHAADMGIAKPVDASRTFTGGGEFVSPTVSVVESTDNLTVGGNTSLNIEAGDCEIVVSLATLRAIVAWAEEP
jgi:hypothetical protein